MTQKLQEAKRLYETANADQKYVLESLFPELAVNEDERIRKELLAWLKSQDGQTLPMDRYNAAIAWLEKQGERKPIISNNALREGIAHFGITQYQIDNWLKKYVDVENLI